MYDDVYIRGVIYLINDIIPWYIYIDIYFHYFVNNVYENILFLL